MDNKSKPNTDKAPNSGVIYALYVSCVIFENYDNKKDLNLKLNEKANDELLELHLFDDEKEYRFIKTRTKVIECVVSDDDYKDNDKYEETVCVQESFKKGPKMVDIINYIEYEDDLLKFVNYRLKMIKGDK